MASLFKPDVPQQDPTVAKQQKDEQARAEGIETVNLLKHGGLTYRETVRDARSERGRARFAALSLEEQEAFRRRFAKKPPSPFTQPDDGAGGVKNQPTTGQHHPAVAAAVKETRCQTRQLF